MDKNILKDIKKEWIKSSTRRMSYQKMRLYSYGLCQGYRQIFSLGHHFFLNRVKDGVILNYYLKKEAYKQNQFLKKKFSNKKYLALGLPKLIRQMEKSYKTCLAEIKKFPQDWRKKDNETLFSGFEYYRKLDNSLGAFHWILFDELERLLTETLKKEMARWGFNAEEISGSISTLFRPCLIAPFDMERLSLLRIVLLDNKEQEKALIKHQREFAYMPMYDIDYEEYSVDYFREKLEEAKNLPQDKIKEERKAIYQKYAERKKQSNKLLKKFKKDKEIYGVIRFFIFFAAYKDYKPYVRDKINYYARGLFKEIARRINLPLTETLFLTELELKQALGGRIKVSAEEIKARVRDSVYFMKDGRVTIIIDKEGLEIIDDILEGKKEEKLIIKGISASSGIVKGQICIVISNSDFLKFSAGKILCTSSTRPDFVSLMKKASAIITDEGGLLSHAAIVSRELGIPCIVGTKIATQVLKDGDLVEVDANMGVVKIIKKNK